SLVRVRHASSSSRFNLPAARAAAAPLTILAAPADRTSVVYPSGGTRILARTARTAQWTRPGSLAIFVLHGMSSPSDRIFRPLLSRVRNAAFGGTLPSLRRRAFGRRALLHPLRRIGLQIGTRQCRGLVRGRRVGGSHPRHLCD